jgi:hypothetical protein
MTNAWKAQLTENLQQAKSLGGSRWQTIRAIWQETWPAIAQELQSGAQEMGQIGRDVAVVAAENVRTEGKTQAVRLRDRVQIWGQGKLADLKAQALVWDVKLEARYGEPYQLIRQAIVKIAERYQANRDPIVMPKKVVIPTIEVPFEVVPTDTNAEIE